jgi:hypothetical protein
MAIYVDMQKAGTRRGNPRHVYLDTEQMVMLDVIGETMGKRHLGVRAKRSQLIFTAVRNFIEECRQEEDLREAIDEHRKLKIQQAVEKPVENS